MGHGNPVALTKLQPQSSLGIDCHSVCSSYIPTQMMLSLQWQRARRHEDFERQGKWAKTVGYSVADVYNLGTIQGARGIGMEKEIGSLEVGKKADIAIFDCQTPGMAVAADRDPVAAIVLHSTVRDVVMVIIDGVLRKKSGVVEPVDVVGDISSSELKEQVQWEDIAHRVIKMGQEIDQKKKTAVDGKVAEEAILKGFHLNVDSWSDQV